MEIPGTEFLMLDWIIHSNYGKGEGKGREMEGDNNYIVNPITCA